MTPDETTPNESIYHRVDDHSLVGPYVVDALEPEEREQFEQHLDTCARCRLEVAELSEALVGVSSTVAVAPPPFLRASILDAIADVPQERPVRDSAAPVDVAPPARPSVVPPLPTPAPSPPKVSEATNAPVDELAVRRNRRLTRVLTLAVAAVTVVALALGGWVYSLNQQQQNQIAARAAAEQQAAAERQRETALLAAADAKVETSTVGSARYSFVVSKSRNEALFIGTDLPSPGPDRRYQLWTVGATALVDNAVSGSGTVRQWFRGPVEQSTALAINIEPTAGPPNATTPSGDILATATV